MKKLKENALSNLIYRNLNYCTIMATSIISSSCLFSKINEPYPSPAFFSKQIDDYDSIPDQIKSNLPSEKINRRNFIRGKLYFNSNIVTRIRNSGTRQNLFDLHEAFAAFEIVVADMDDIYVWRKFSKSITSYEIGDRYHFRINDNLETVRAGIDGPLDDLN